MSRDAVRVQKKDRFPARQLARSYPAAAEQLLARYQKYNDGVALAKRYEAEGRLLIVAPDDCCGMTTLHRTQESLMQMYDKGVRGAETIAPLLQYCDGLFCTRGVLRSAVEPVGSLPNFALGR